MVTLDYDDFKKKRTEFTNNILESDSRNKVILAGPGTGKSFLFQQICERNIVNGKDKNLALSFINELVNDLSDDLYGLAEVHTLHRFALSKFPGKCKMYIHLCDVIREEYLAVTGLDIDFKEIFSNMIDAKTELHFYSDRRKYYNFVSPSCSIFGLIKYWELNPDKIPLYSQILIDEYQDFNKLEIKLIDLLSEKNPILVAGDDDQSLYDFKYAIPDTIRARFNDKSYDSFNLPYCSRCSDVIIRAFNSFLKTAQKNGFLKSRINKAYEYFPTEYKDKISHENPKVILKTGIYDSMIPYNIESEIKELYKSKDKDFNILVIIPSTIKKKLSKINKSLKQNGFINVQTPKSKSYNPLLEGFILLLDNKECNLGWRIVFRELASKEDDANFKEVLNKSIADPNISIRELVKDARHDLYIEIRTIRAILIKILNNKHLCEEEYNKIVNLFEVNKLDLLSKKMKNALIPQSLKSTSFYKLPIRLTTILGSKGLTYDYVFLVNFDDKYLLNNGNINDKNICEFLVSLTRARKRVYIYSSEKNSPTFVNWIDKSCFY